MYYIISDNVLLKHSVFHFAGVSIQISLTSGKIDVIVSMPLTVQNQTSGLLGNFNNNPDDDLTAPNGTVLHKNSTQKTIYYDFGERCKLFSTKFTQQEGADLSFLIHYHFTRSFCIQMSTVHPYCTARKYECLKYIHTYLKCIIPGCYRVIKLTLHLFYTSASSILSLQCSG